MSSPPVHCLLSGSSYLILYLAKHFESRRGGVLLTCKSCALNLCPAADLRRSTLNFRSAFLIFWPHTRRLPGQRDTNPELVWVWNHFLSLLMLHVFSPLCFLPVVIQQGHLLRHRNDVQSRWRSDLLSDTCSDSLLY